MYFLFPIQNLFLINETLTNGYTTNALNVFFCLAIFSAIFVIISKNPIVSVLFLIGLFASISSYLIILGLGFIGLSYLIVYIGAVSILFLFILMLINIRISELQNNTYNTIPLIIFISILLSYPLFKILPYDIAVINNSKLMNNEFYGLYLDKHNLDYFKNLQYYNNDLSYVSSNIWDGNLIENNHMTAIGNILYTNYNIWLLLVSIILLLAMVGCIVITLKSKNE